MASQTLLDLLIEAMKDEKHDRKKYALMMDMSKSDLVKREIQFAYIDESIHYKMFRQIYYELTEKYIDVARPPVKLVPTLIGNIKTSIDSELAAVKMYKKIYSIVNSRSMCDRVLRIITDEQEHATRFVYVYAILK